MKKEYSIKDRLKIWYQGEPYIPEFPAEHVKFKRPFIVRVAIKLKEFWLTHWKWIIGTMIALIALWQTVKTK